jgi:hypothetical protein
VPATVRVFAIHAFPRISPADVAIEPGDLFHKDWPITDNSP